jgi:hypothetical protein
MFDEQRSPLSERPAPADLWNMKPPFAHLSPTVLATFAAAISTSLSLFLLPGAGVQGQPIPLLPAIGGAAGHVVADFATPAHKRSSSQLTTAASAQPVVAPAVAVRHVTAPRAAAPKAHRPHRARARVVRQAPPAPVHVMTPVATRQFLSAPKARGKAHGHGHKTKPAAGVAAHGHGHGKGLGHSPEHHKQLPPGQAKKAPAASPAAPPKEHGGGPPADHGGGNGHKGGKK